jgi:sucrose-phosphate synthase
LSDNCDYLQEILGTQLQVIPPGMDFSTVVVADAGDVVEGEVDSVTFTGDATNVVPVSPRANPPIWDEVQFRTATHHLLMYNCGFKDPNVKIIIK